MWTLGMILALLVGYFVVQEALRRIQLPTMLLLFGAIPLMLTPLWIAINDFNLFLWLKIYSMMFCICWATSIRFTSLRNRDWALASIPFLFAANILEATLLDLFSEGWSHRCNAFSGILLLLTLPYGAKSVTVDRDDSLREMRFNVRLPWILGYTLWNGCFVYLNYPGFMGQHVAILGAALVVGCLDSSRWMQARGATLGVSLLLTASHYTGMQTCVDTTHWFDSQIAMTLAIASFGWMCMVTGSYAKVFQEPQQPNTRSGIRREFRGALSNFA